MTARPQIDLGVDLQARQLDPERYEVELKLRVSAKVEEKTAFMLELVYAGLFLIQSAPEELLQPILLIEGPHILFPFARRIVADVIRDGGMPPLMIEPIDFASLFRARTGQPLPGEGPRRRESRIERLAVDPVRQLLAKMHVAERRRGAHAADIGCQVRKGRRRPRHVAGPAHENCRQKICGG